MIDHTVEYMDPESGELAKGEVKAVRLDEGVLTVDLGDRTIPLENVVAVVTDSDGDDEESA